MSVHRRRIVLRLERLMIATGLACLAWCAFTIIEASWWQREYRKALEWAPTAPDRGSATSASVAELTAIRPGDPIGEVEVPRLHLSAVIVEGDDDASLERAVGHLPDTPPPWDSGNTALAAHRDTYFRPLEHIKAGDIVRLSTRRGRLTTDGDLSSRRVLPKMNLRRHGLLRHPRNSALG